MKKQENSKDLSLDLEKQNKILNEEIEKMN